jgi:hypothetical protein
MNLWFLLLKVGIDLPPEPFGKGHPQMNLIGRVKDCFLHPLPTLEVHGMKIVDGWVRLTGGVN